MEYFLHTLYANKTDFESQIFKNKGCLTNEKITI